MAKQPNIVLMGVDSLLATHMSCYGYHRLTTPHIDRFAEGATLFEKLLQSTRSNNERVRLYADRIRYVQHTSGRVTSPRTTSGRG